MGKFDGILLCSDFDGTLYHDKKISDENLCAIRYFQDNGGLFTVVSGRFPEFFGEFAGAFVPNTYIIGLNGAVIYDGKSGKRLYEGSMPQGTVGLTETILFNMDIKRVVLHDYEHAFTLTRESWKTACRPEILSKVLFIVGKEDSDRVKTEIERNVPLNIFAVERSWVNGIELLNARNTKGRTVRRLAGMLGGAVRRIVCVGDYENDITMIREADIGYAVGDAVRQVKDAADRITVGAGEHAIASIISELDGDTAVSLSK